MNISQLFKEARSRTGLSRTELALKSGISPSTIARYERDEFAKPEIQTLFRLCSALDVDPDLMLVLLNEALPIFHGGSLQGSIALPPLPSLAADKALLIDEDIFDFPKGTILIIEDRQADRGEVILKDNQLYLALTNELMPFVMNKEGNVIRLTEGIEGTVSYTLQPAKRHTDKAREVKISQPLLLRNARPHAPALYNKTTRSFSPYSLPDRTRRGGNFVVNRSLSGKR